MSDDDEQNTDDEQKAVVEVYCGRHYQGCQTCYARKYLWGLGDLFSSAACSQDQQAYINFLTPIRAAYNPMSFLLWNNAQQRFLAILIPGYLEISLLWK